SHLPTYRLTFPLSHLRLDRLEARSHFGCGSAALRFGAAPARVRPVLVGRPLAGFPLFSRAFPPIPTQIFSAAACARGHLQKEIKANQAGSNPIKPSRMQSSPIKVDQARSSPIKAVRPGGRGVLPGKQGRDYAQDRAVVTNLTPS